MRFVNIIQFAKMKKCSRETVYKAERKGEIEIDRTAGFPIIYLSEKNLYWKPKRQGRPPNKVLDIS